VPRARRAAMRVRRRRDEARGRAVAAASAACEGVALDRLLDPSSGRGSRDVAAGCAVPATHDPVASGMVGCALGRLQCLGEETVAAGTPRAYDVLSTLDLDPDESFPCVVDPADVGSPSGAFVDPRSLS
jgi:hypothetical protein